MNWKDFKKQAGQENFKVYIPFRCSECQFKTLGEGRRWCALYDAPTPTFDERLMECEEGTFELVRSS
jgi:hypothetical protein